MRYAGAEFVGCYPQNFSTSPISHKFIVVHVAGGESQSGTDAWFKEAHPASVGPTSAHFSIGKNGDVHQYIDTNQTAYHCAGWNDRAIGIEHLGLSGDHLTPQQKRASLALMKWINKTHGTRLVYTQNPNDPRGGVIGHGKIPEGSLSHPNCPGQPILNDIIVMLRPTFIKRIIHPFRRLARPTAAGLIA